MRIKRGIALLTFTCGFILNLPACRPAQPDNGGTTAPQAVIDEQAAISTQPHRGPDMNADDQGGRVVFEDTFKDLANWVVEEWDGKVTVDLKDGQMHVTTASRINGVMIWCRQILPDDFIFEFDVTPLSASGFFLLFFNTQGNDGKDILDPVLFDDRPADVTDFKNCLFYKYTQKINGYHMSYRRNESATCNLRRNAGLVLLKQQELATVLPAGKTVHVELRRQGAHMTLTVDGQVFMEHTDDAALGPVWRNGRIGFRQVYESEGLYGNVKLTELP